MADYFIAINDQQQGPFPAHELVARGMRPGSKVWREGMTDWQRADSVPELAAMMPSHQAPPKAPPAGAWAPPQQQFSVPLPPSMQYGGPPPYNPASSNRVLAGLFGLFLGAFGIHKFIIGQTGAGVTMLLVTVLTCGFAGVVMGTIGLIEGIIYLSKSDEEFYQTYVLQQRAWF
jgi:TM2 domain-containing membrane protein YozV